MYESQLQISGSASETCMHMMHDRMVALEAQVAQLTKLVKELRFKKYDALEKQFSDGSNIDWYIWEPVHSMHVAKEGSFLQPLDETYWEAMVSLPVYCIEWHSHNQVDTRVKLKVPVSRHCDEYDEYDEYRIILMPQIMTVREFFTAIYNFYATEITSADMEGLGETQCTINAVLKLSQGEIVTWADLLGTKNMYSPGAGGVETSTRRHLSSCNGLVRYEGVKRSDKGFLLLLGV